MTKEVVPRILTPLMVKEMKSLDTLNNSSATTTPTMEGKTFQFRVA